MQFRKPVETLDLGELLEHLEVHGIQLAIGSRPGERLVTAELSGEGDEWADEVFGCTWTMLAQLNSNGAGLESIEGIPAEHWAAIGCPDSTLNSEGPDADQPPPSGSPPKAKPPG